MKNKFFFINQVSCLYIFTGFLFYTHTVFSLQKQDLLQKFISREKIDQISGIDEIYVINLKKRPEKLAYSIAQLKKFNLTCVKFDAIDGSLIDTDMMVALGNKIHSNSCFDKKIYGMNALTRKTQYISKNDIDQVFFRPQMTRGAIGCYLSHLSILQHALEKDYKAILILEDDFIIKNNPNCISGYIEEIDQIVTRDGWDVLFLNDLSNFRKSTSGRNHPDQNILFENFINNENTKNQISDQSRILLSKRLGYLVYESMDNFGPFRKISGRWGTYAMVVNQAGMKKILNFFYTYGMFWPYDDELSFILDLQMFNLKKTIFDVSRSISDIATIK